MVTRYRGAGSAGYHPALLLGLLVYGYATGVFSSRKLEQATYDSVAFRFIAANDHPDHDTIATFRRRFLKEIEALFVRVLEVAHEMGLLKIGTVALDGTKIHANASRHNALSNEHATKLEAATGVNIGEVDVYNKSTLVDTLIFNDSVPITTLEPVSDNNGGTEIIVDPTSIPLADPQPPGEAVGVSPNFIDWNFIHNNEGGD